MSYELTLLVWSTALVAVYVSTQAILYRLDYGFAHAATPRDRERRPGILAERGARALRNLLETYGAFVALAVAIEMSGKANGLTFWGGQLYFWARWVYLPLYIAGVPYWRSFIWSVGALGLTLMFFGVAF